MRGISSILLFSFCRPYRRGRSPVCQPVKSGSTFFSYHQRLTVGWLVYRCDSLFMLFTKSIFADWANSSHKRADTGECFKHYCTLSFIFVYLLFGMWHTRCTQEIGWEKNAFHSPTNQLNIFFFNEIATFQRKLLN